MDWRRVDVGVIGDRKERVSSTGCVDLDRDCGAGMEYVKFVVDVSNWAPRYAGKVILYLDFIS